MRSPLSVLHPGTDELAMHLGGCCLVSKVLERRDLTEYTNGKPSGRPELPMPQIREEEGTKGVTPAGCQHILPGLGSPSGRRQSASVPAQRDLLQHLHSPDISSQHRQMVLSVPPTGTQTNVCALPTVRSTHEQCLEFLIVLTFHFTHLFGGMWASMPVHVRQVHLQLGCEHITAPQHQAACHNLLVPGTRHGQL